MKKTILISAAICFFTVPAAAQMMGGYGAMQGDDYARERARMMHDQQQGAGEAEAETAQPWAGYYGAPMMGYGMGPNMMGYGAAPNMMGGYGMNPMMGYGMGPNMMGGYGMNPNMMGGYPMMGGYGMGPNMMGGYGMNPMMMNPNMMGYGMGPSMMGYGMGSSMMGGFGGYGHHDRMHSRAGQYGMYPGGCGLGAGETDADQQKFLDSTRETRRQLHNLMFDYMEAARAESPDKEAVAKLQAEIKKLQEEILKTRE